MSLQFSSGSARLAAVAIVLGFMSPAFAASGDSVTISESLSSIPQNSAITLVDLGTAASAGYVSDAPISILGGSADVSFTSTAGSPTSGVYNGSTSGIAAAPYTTTGLDKTNYLAAEPKGAVTVAFASSQQYFGVLWGSVDTYNTLSFYNNNTLVESITGSQISANANGNQTAAGSYIVNVDFNSGSFNKVVATTTSPAFEFDSVAYAATPVPITAATIAAAGNLGETRVVNANPAPLPLLGATPLGFSFLGFSAWRIRRRRNAA